MKRAWKQTGVGITVVGLSAMVVGGCEPKKEKEAPSSSTSAAVAPAPTPTPTADAVDLPDTVFVLFKPLPARFEGKEGAQGLSDARVSLGRTLYFENRLSKGQTLSCNSCHKLDQYGADGEPTSPGHKGQRGGRNSPTVYNAAGHFVQFWDGRAANVEEQAKGPVLNPIEMAMPDEKAVVAVLKSIPAYAASFKAAFPEDKDPITYDNMAKAIGAFERTLVLPSRWDKFLGGDKKALTDAEKKGLKKFMDTGCTGCHMGPLLGGSTYQKLGVVEPWPSTKDQGRFDVTKSEGDKMMFKVPSLRNVAKTAPYFHDGSVATLPKAVELMAKHQLGKTLSEADVTSIVVFLESLTGELPPASVIGKPELPAGSAKTPKPAP